MTKAWFVTGTDTEIGKTTFTTLMMDYLRTQQLSVAGLKPVASGAININGQLVNEDVVALQAHSSKEFTLKDLNPYCFSPAIAPHIAAQEAGIHIDFNVIKAQFDELQEQVDCVLVEGAGGILVPLDETRLTLDLCHALALPVIIVVGMRLGCINHALLTERAIKNAGLTVTGWVANCIDPNMSRFTDNLETLKKLMHSPLIATIPFQPEAQKSIQWLIQDNFF